jgi:nicotinamide riboside kinase
VVRQHATTTGSTGVKRPRLIALTGVESSGKTTLATLLAAELSGHLVNEASRDLLTPGQPYALTDVVAIAREQHRREQEAIRTTESWVVADTDLLVIRIWLDERFGVWPAELEHLWQAQAPRLWVLTAPDIPWEPDPLRENPHDRDRLHARYRQALESFPEPWIEVSGSVEARLRQVQDWLSDQLSG